MRARTTKTIAAFAVAALAVMGIARVHAQTDPGDHHMRRGSFGRGFGARFGPHGMAGLPLRGLDLTDEQRTQVRAIMDQHRDELRTAGQRVGVAFRAQNEAVSTVPVDEGLVRAKAAEVAAAQTELALVHARVHSAVFEVLTPEQQVKAKELKAQRKARRAERLQKSQERRQQRQKQ